MAEQVHSITDAPLKHSDEQRGRMVRYTIAMAIRIVCFILAAVVGVVWETWWSMVLVMAAVVLPYVAVVNANAGGDRYMASREADGLHHPVSLAAGQEEPESPQWWEDDDRIRAKVSDEVISGEVVPSAELVPGPDEPHCQGARRGNI